LHADAAGSLEKGAKGVVTSINGKGGELTLQGGMGTRIQTNGNTITITANSLIDNGGQQPQATKVTSVTGTANQITAAPTINDVVLSLPQNIHTGATPQFINLNLTGIPGSSSYTEFLVSNGGMLQKRTLSSLAGSYWSLTGNSGSTPGTNFIGTTDNVSLQFRVNNQQSGLVEVPNNLNDGNTGLGYKILVSNTTGHGNTAIGFIALSSNTVGFWNVAVGDGSLDLNTSGSYNTATGTGALFSNTTGDFNTADGDGALLLNTTGTQNFAGGGLSLFSNTSGSNNSANGYQSLYSNTTGSGNLGSGTFALTTNTTGSNNTALGYLADVSSSALTNATAIGYNAKVGASNSLVLGGTGGDAVKVGIGITTPAQTLDVNGRARIENLPANTDDNLVTANGSGDLSVRSATSLISDNAWTLTGNAGTTAGTNFVGPTDNKALYLQVKNGVTVNNSFILSTNGSIQRDAGGNARGENAVDHQISRSAATQVASGIGSVIGGGGIDFFGVGGNTASGSASVVAGGFGNAALDNYSTVAGGLDNIAGGYANFIGGGQDNTTSEYGSTIGGGESNIASGLAGSTVGGGQHNTASGPKSTVPGGYSALADKYGQYAHGSGNFDDAGSARGGAQGSEFILRKHTTNANATDLFLDEFTERMTVPTNATWVFHGFVAARDNGGAGATSDGWEIKGIVQNKAGAVTTIGTTVTQLGVTAWTVALGVNGTALNIRVTGAAATNIRWVARVETAEVTY
jgi:hypothetical protein